MNRSRTQIATSYAPGALFTYEGGLGCCVSVPKMSRLEHIAGAVQHQLFESLQEFVETWHQRAMACRTAPEVFSEQCLDGEFLDHRGQPRIDMGKFVLCQPNRMGFVPDPLVFVCSECQRIVEFKDVIDLDRNWTMHTKRDDCKKSEEKHHKFRQMDVVFAHWSGNYAGLSPARVVMDTTGNIDAVRTCRNCGNEEYQLRTNSSPFFSEWRFQCVNCLSLTPVVQADRDTLALLMPKMVAKSGHLPKEWNMLPVSYRASSVYYVQRDSFIVFADPDLSSLLNIARRNDLANRLMKLFEFPGSLLDDDEVIKQLSNNGRGSDATQYSVLKQMIGFAPDESSKNVLRQQLAMLAEQFQVKGFVVRQRDPSPILLSQIADAVGWARRFNPIRLALEHASLRDEVIDRQGSVAELPAISVTNPDVMSFEVEELKLRSAYTARVSADLMALGVEEMVLIKGLDICEYSFGFSRVSSLPWTTIKDREMPVRLKAFDHVDTGKRPLYVLQQKNEAIYVRLTETRVLSWLAENGLQRASKDAQERLGGSYISEYIDFGRFLESYREGTGGIKNQRSIPNYVYLLLHTMAHHVAQSVVEYSGLEHGSIGEYIFPADLSFLVYRKGMTPDLGNISAMWRNYGPTLLGDLLTDRSLRCDAGSLCDQRGGACPACIMAPEVACIGGNNLLCRAALNGGPAPSWDVDSTPLFGYLRGKHNLR
jgi:hypothetical protein